MPLRLSRTLLRVSAIGAVMAASLVPALAVAARPTQPFAAAAIFPPWWSRDRVEAAIEDLGTVTRRGRLPTVVSLTGGADLQRQLLKAGAWVVIDPRLATCASQGPLQ
jgi:hypothetical protein